MADMWPFVLRFKAAIPRGRPNSKHANSSKTPYACISKADWRAMSQYTRKSTPIKCESQCDSKASCVQFPQFDFHTQEAWLCLGPAVWKPCCLHPSRRAQDDCPDPRQT